MTPPASIEVPAGSFLQGGSAEDKFVNSVELPTREVVFHRPFRLSIFPVSVEDWAHFRTPPAGNPAGRLPVVSITWHEAIAYCAWLSRNCGGTWRLPSEAEWEYACRAGTATAFSCGATISVEQANFLYSESGTRIGIGQLLPSGSFAPNSFGLYDMHGNVCEWTLDSWRPCLDPRAPVDPERKSVRGGAWDYLPRMLRSSWRDGTAADSRRDNLGFRVLGEM